MQNNFSKCREWGPRGTSQHKWRWLTTLLLILTLGIGQMWGADAVFNGPTDLSSSWAKGKSFTITTTTNGVIADNTVYYSSSEGKVDNSKINPYRVGFVFKPQVNCNLTVTAKASSTGKSCTHLIYEVNDSLYNLYKDAAGKSMAAYIISTYASDANQVALWKAVSVLKNQASLQANGDSAKVLCGYTLKARLLTLVATSKSQSISNSKDQVYTLIDADENKIVLEAGKKYLMFTNTGSTGVALKSLTFTPVYQLTWALDGGSITSAADAYTNAGYYAAGTALTAPTVEKSGFDFSGWSPTVAATMPAEAKTYTAQWALAGSAYNVNIASMTNGSVVASPASQVEDGTVTLTVTPDDGYLLSSLSVVGDVSGDEVTVTANQFTMPAEDVTVNATFSLAPTYTVTLNPAGGTIVDATGWTLNAGNYEKEVAEGTELTLPTFTKANRAFKTWRNGAVDVTSPITVTGDVTLTAVWNATVENVIYSWESPSGTVIETGGTAVTYKGDDPVDGDPEVNVPNNGNYVLQVSGDNTASSSKNHIRITLTSGNAVKSGDKVKLIAYANNPSNNTRPRLIDGSGNQLCVAGSNMPAYTDPYIGTLTVADGINTELIKLTRASGYTGTNTMVKKLQIVRETLVEEANLRTVTFNYNDGGATSSTTVEVASGATVAAPANPTWAHHRFHEWQLGGVAYDFATAVTSNITLTADWTQLYTVTYAKGEESATGDAPTQDELAAGENFTVAANTFAYEGHDFSTWNDGSKDVAPASEYTMGSANVTLTAQWITATTKVTVTYKDGETTLGSEEVTISTGHPAEYATYQTKNLATFDGWYSDPDLAEGHKIADISTLTASADVNVYGKWNYQYASSANIEQWTLDNGKGVSDAQKETQTGALMSLLGTRKYASNIAYDKGSIELDSLNDDPGKTNRNNAYLGLKVKMSGKMLDFRLAKDSYVKVKFGNVAATPKVSINGADYADMEITDGVYSYTATGNDYISIKTASDGAVVFKQIMINEEIQNVILPAIVTLDANGGTYADASVKYTGTALVIGDATPADEYHVFAGWFDGDDQINATAYVPTKNVTLQAHYAPKPYSITYMPNGGSGAEFITDDNATEVAEGTLFTAPASSAFVEWNTQADGNGDSYLPGAAVTADLTLFAQWETSYPVTFDLQGHGDAIDPQNIVSGGKVVKPADPSADAWEFGGWYKESTCENEWNFATDVVTTTTTIFAKWTADPCPTPFSLSKVVLTSASDGTVTGYNNDEYAGEKVIGGLGESQTADVDPSHEGAETGYKLSSGGSAIVFATLKKGTFQVGDRVVVTITKAQDAYKVEEVAQPILDIYYGTDKNDATFLTTIENVTAAGTYTYRLTAADVTAIGTKKGIGVFRPSSGRTQNPFVYSVEIKGCREWAIFHTLTFKNIDGTATIAAESLEEGAYASTVAPAAPKITLKRFLGWAEATDGTPVDLTAYTITEDKTLYAVYEDIDCSATGVKFSMTPKANELTENYEPKGDEERDYAEYATLVGGKVFINNVDASNKRISVLKETSHIKLEGGDDGYIHVELDCPLNEKDTIKIENDQKWKVSVAKGSGYVAKVKADKYHVVPAAWDGKYDFYIKRDGSSLTISGIQVVRPAKFDVSFNMMGHGTQIADIEDVIDGSKITAPTAPSDVDYSFAGWYKENTLENEWNFDVDVVETNTTLYAKWLDKSDATLKSLMYGAEEIALEAGEFTYNVNLSPLATTVPALTAVTSNPNATAQVNNAAALDGEGHATSTVVVTPEVGAAKTYTVNFTKVHLYTELVDVTGHTEWSWVGMSTQEIDKANEIGTILANYVIGNHFEKIEGKADEFASRNTDGGVYQGTYLKFHTTVPGAVTVTYRGTGNSSNVTLTIGTEQLETYAGGFTDSKKVIVPAGDVKITSEGTMRVQKIVFQTLDEVTPDYSRPVTIDRMGTVCVDHNVPAGCFIGAEVYRLLYWKYGTSYADCLMVDFEEVDEMEAGNPYLIIPTEETFKLYYGGVKDETPNEVNHFIGTYNPIAQGTEGDAILMGKYGVVNNQIRLLGSGAYSPANRAYIDLENLQSKEEYEAANPSNPAPKKRISLSREGAAVATGLDAINVDTETVQKVMIDGQMYIIRGGHIFTVSGNLVK